MEDSTGGLSVSGNSVSPHPILLTLVVFSDVAANASVNRLAPYLKRSQSDHTN